MQEAAHAARPQMIGLPANQPYQPVHHQPRREHDDHEHHPVFAQKFQQRHMIRGKQCPDRVDQRTHPAHQYVKQRIRECSHVASGAGFFSALRLSSDFL